MNNIKRSIEHLMGLQDRDLMMVLLYVCCVNLDKSLPFSGPQFPPP